MIKHVKKILLCLVLLWSCQDKTRRNDIDISRIQNAELTHSSGEWIMVDILFSDFQKSRGLSGIKSSEFPENKGAFFFFRRDGQRNFWMPDTYFNLDIIYLDKDLKIVEIHNNIPFHPGYKESPPIPRMNSVWCRHVLEIKASSAFSKLIKIGDVLKWNAKYSLKMIQKAF
ncbi:MAG: hypothetical protein DRQ88_05060 [Epsilonproteobacteria bacterium]|nr:MAG: hypothetical protein DRQ88_05060 [Campylobacterota bacterium]